MIKASQQLSVNYSTGFGQWLNQNHISLTFSTYQVGKLFFLGSEVNDEMSLFERNFQRCMGIGLDPETQALWVASLYQLWRFDNALQKGQKHQGHDAVYIPQLGYTTGHLDTHDVVIDKVGPVFVNTQFNCLARPSIRYSFEPIWKPSFIKKIVPEDHCHLNGVCIKDGDIKYVTAFSTSDERQGWRNKSTENGVAIDVPNNEIIAQNLNMPHSPRWYKDKLWLLNSGTGEFGNINLNTGKFEPMTFCPGYLRGLSFYGDFAVVGLSKLREKKSLNSDFLRDRLKAKNLPDQCGLMVINITTGEVAHQLLIQGVVEELYDVCVIPKIQKPMALGFKTDEIKHFIALPPKHKFI